MGPTRRPRVCSTARQDSTVMSGSLKRRRTMPEMDIADALASLSSSGEGGQLSKAASISDDQALSRREKLANGVSRRLADQDVSRIGGIKVVLSPMHRKQHPCGNKDRRKLLSGQDPVGDVENRDPANGSAMNRMKNHQKDRTASATLTREDLRCTENFLTIQESMDRTTAQKQSSPALLEESNGSLVAPRLITQRTTFSPFGLASSNVSAQVLSAPRSGGDGGWRSKRRRRATFKARSEEYENAILGQDLSMMLIGGRRFSHRGTGDLEVEGCSRAGEVASQASSIRKKKYSFEWEWIQRRRNMNGLFRMVRRQGRLQRHQYSRRALIYVFQ